MQDLDSVTGDFKSLQIRQVHQRAGQRHDLVAAEVEVLEQSVGDEHVAAEGCQFIDAQRNVHQVAHVVESVVRYVRDVVVHESQLSHAVLVVADEREQIAVHGVQRLVAVQTRYVLADDEREALRKSRVVTI